LFRQGLGLHADGDGAFVGCKVGGSVVGCIVGRPVGAGVGKQFSN